jgi:class 3 adenylate cyclase/tetratricopeptide (TPR) repeat protein
MQQIADWLRKLGMSEYAERFAENDIEIDVLPELTDHDLQKLGLSLGHRRRILRAIRELGGPAPAAPQTAAASPGSQDTAERRQLTVMFCDLVGSTALSVKLDPEDLRGIIAGYHRCCTELVERNGGFVARHMGDGVLAYFGYPRAHEHDAERAVRAGLALVEAVQKLETAADVRLQARIGIATGLVVVGDLIGTGTSQEQAVVGETPNLAARLQALADPGAVVIESRTRRMTGGLFEYRDLGTVALKGFAQNVPAWQVLRADATVSRFEALHAATTPLIGRDEEIDLLLRRWDQARRGEGCVVLISGEPGITPITIGVTGLGAWILGRADSARERIASTLAFAQDSKRPYDLAMALLFEGYLHRFQREPRRAEAAGAQLLSLSEEHGFAYAGDLARGVIGWARAQLGRTDEGVSLIRQALAGLTERGAKVGNTDVLTRLAEAQALDGATREALDTMELALKTSPEELVFRPNAVRYRGALRLKVGQNELAEADFRDAITMAQRMSAKAWELRAATSLARLWRDQGRQQRARDLLAPVYSSFTEGLNALDLEDSKALLDQLA